MIKYRSDKLHLVIEKQSINFVCLLYDILLYFIRRIYCQYAQTELKNYADI
jgi:hypothetical protein